ncbi:hypothetical protein [Prosthecobacter sp.]|uniref:hypothetical protein n=1 Tax=Prosthecobacter sp. TaxID=1965333 RepID=UPI0037841771
MPEVPQESTGGSDAGKSKIQKLPTGEFHSGYGCIIMSAVIGIFGFIVWWSYYTLTTMDAAIAAITQAAPAKLPDVTVVPGLEQRLADFGAAATAGKPATLKLSVADLNSLLLLAPDGGAGSYKDMLRVKALDAEKRVIIADISMPLNKKFWEDSKRYLVGEMDVSLEMTEVGPDAKPSAVRVPGKTVPEEMVKGMAMYGYLRPYQNDPNLEPVLKAIKKVAVEADGVVVTTEEEKK